MAPTWPIPSFRVASPPPPPHPDSIIVLSDDEDEVIVVSDNDIQNHQPSLALGSDDIPEEEEEEPVAAVRMYVPCYGHWSFTDELNILKELASRSRGGVQPAWEEVYDALQKKDLLRKDATIPDLRKKVHNLRKKFHKADETGGPQEQGRRLVREQKLYELSKEIEIWPSKKRRS